MVVEPCCTTRLMLKPKFVLARLLLTNVSALGGAWVNTGKVSRAQIDRLHAIRRVIN